MAHADQAVSYILEEFGAEAYGVWWLMLEEIAAPMEPGKMMPNASHSLLKWSQICHCSTRRFRSIVSSLANKQLIYVQTELDRIQIEVPNILKYKDEYSKKSGQSTEQEQKQIQRESRDKPDSEYRSWFDTEFWPIWPVKENKPAAAKAAEKVPEADRPSAIEGVHKQGPRIKGMERPIHAATWLNNRRWEDEEHTPLFFQAERPAPPTTSGSPLTDYY